MMSSPRKKKIKIEEAPNCPNSKRSNIGEESAAKRIKSEKEVDIHSLKRKNFISACEQVSFKAYYDFKSRLQLVYLPGCMDTKKCSHQGKNQALNNVREMPNYTEESVKIELSTNMWREALEVCQLCVSYDQFLSAYIMKEIVEIMMNVHGDEFLGYTAEDIIEKAHLILTLNFSMHPPCSNRLRDVYKTFLTTPMDLKQKTFTNRSEYECDKGIVKYCMNRLEYEISIDSKDEPLIDKYENIPDDMKQGVKGVYWQKEKFEIFEVLDRPERIQRLMAVLGTIIELLQFDLVLWHSRYTNNLGNHMMRSHKPLMAYVLWSNVLCTGGVNNICRQFLRIFAHMIHLRYPEDHIKIMTTWLNTMIQVFYICENNSNIDYPNTGKYCMAFAKEFYRIIADLPHDTMLRILYAIKPSFMVNLIGTLHIKTILNIQEDNILKIFLNFINKKQWENFPKGDNDIVIPKKLNVKPKKAKDNFRYIAKACDVIIPEPMDDIDGVIYEKYDSSIIINHAEINQNDIVNFLYVTVEAYLDAHSVQLVQDTIENLNERLTQADGYVISESAIPEHCSYSVTEHFIKRYRTIFEVSTELVPKLHNMKASNELPNCVLKISNALGFIES